MAQRIGILTAGGDAPGLNAAIRGFGKAAIQEHGWRLIGFRDGMRGLAENRFVELDGPSLSGILTTGGTMLGTSRDKVHRMVVDGETRDMIPTIVENYARDELDALVCLGGGGTAKNARRLMDAGLNVLHLPKTIDNDIVRTDTSFGFATALEIATEAVDRLHSTAHSHHRIILTEIMGHRAGWLALGATPSQSTAWLRRLSVRESLLPNLDQTRNTGLVTLPGAFIGALFGGASPVEAAMFQLTMLSAILVSAAVTGTLFSTLSGRSPVLPAPQES